ncbi:MAG: outer membrane protein assembly factor BamE [Victivallales bacterium]|nr:outer membrane protein assembly factor BamE [Victivallales bacterium]MBT7302874.1 outer membrane protein assembly factor BamE [Victivallales bacterium]
MKTRTIISVVMSCGCLMTSSCQKQTPIPQSSDLSDAHMTGVELAQVKAKFKASPGFRTKEARILAPMITRGMTRNQVREILGEPDKEGALASSDDIWHYTVFYSQLIAVVFENDRVIRTHGTGIK